MVAARIDAKRRTRSTMPLQGTFDVLSFPDVLTLLASKTGTGRLHARSRAFTANVFFRDGRMVAADLGDSVSSVGDVAGRLEEICFELLEAERGSFEFMPDTMGTVESALTLEVDEVLEGARKRLDEWREIQAVVPSVDLHPKVVVDLDKEEVTLSRDRWRLLTAVDGRRSIRAIARSLSMSEYEICGMVKSLVEDGVLEFVGPALSLVAANREPMVFIDGSLEEGVADPPESAPPLPAHMVQASPPISAPTPTEPPPEAPAARDQPETTTGSNGSPPVPSYPAPTGPPADLRLPPPQTPVPKPPAKRERQKTVRVSRRRHPSQTSKSATPETAPPATSNGDHSHDGPECVQ
jgi:hypothetical protein